MKNIAIQLAAVGLLALGSAPALAGKGGSAERIQAAVASGSTDAIAAELERTESLICEACVPLVTALTEDTRYSVREVAAWWFSRRPGLRDMLVDGFVADLPHGDTTKVRNAADFLGRNRTLSAIAPLRAAIHRTDLGVEARLAVVRAIGSMRQTSGNDVLVTAMADSDAGVRALAVTAWRGISGQENAQPVVPLLADRDALVRAQAAAVIGTMTEQTGRAALEAMVVGDLDPAVRRNAAWALGELGNAASRAVLIQATSDRSGLVSGVAKASLAKLH